MYEIAIVFWSAIAGFSLLVAVGGGTIHALLQPGRARPSVPAPRVDDAYAYPTLEAGRLSEGF